MDILKKERLNEALDKFYKEYDRKSRIASDPIEFPHLYKDPLEIEIAGLIASSLAFGSVSVFKPVIKKILDLAEGDLINFVKDFNPHADIDLFKNIEHRMCKYNDIACLIYMVGNIVKEYGGIGALFLSLYRDDDPDIKETMIRFVDRFDSIDTTPIYGSRVYPRGLRQLLPSPRKGSACKKLNLYLRWMVRSGDGVDFGLWDQIPKKKLIIPFDTHIGKICRNLGLIKVKNQEELKSPKWWMAEEVTENLKLLDPEDPVKYDFPLCHLGISGKCKGEYNKEVCPICSLDDVCTKGA